MGTGSGMGSGMFLIFNSIYIKYSMEDAIAAIDADLIDSLYRIVIDQKFDLNYEELFEEAVRRQAIACLSFLVHEHEKGRIHISLSHDRHIISDIGDSASPILLLVARIIDPSRVIFAPVSTDNYKGVTDLVAIFGAEIASDAAYDGAWMDYCSPGMYFHLLKLGASPRDILDGAIDGQHLRPFLVAIDSGVILTQEDRRRIMRYPNSNLQSFLD